MSNWSNRNNDLIIPFGLIVVSIVVSILIIMFGYVPFNAYLSIIVVPLSVMIGMMTWGYIWERYLTGTINKSKTQKIGKRDQSKLSPSELRKYDFLLNEEPVRYSYYPRLMTITVGVLLLGGGMGFLSQPALMLKMSGTFLLVTGVQILLWAVGIRLEILGNVPTVTDTSIVGAHSADINSRHTVPEKTLPPLETGGILSHVLEVYCELESATRELAIEYNLYDPDICPTTRSLLHELRVRNIIDETTSKSIINFMEFRNKFLNDGAAMFKDRAIEVVSFYVMGAHVALDTIRKKLVDSKSVKKSS